VLAPLPLPLPLPSSSSSSSSPVCSSLLRCCCCRRRRRRLSLLRSFVPSLSSLRLLRQTATATANDQRTADRQRTNDGGPSEQRFFIQRPKTKDQRPTSHNTVSNSQSSFNFHSSLFIHSLFAIPISKTIAISQFRNFAISQFRNFAISQFRIPTLHSSFTTPKIKRKNEK